MSKNKITHFSVESFRNLKKRNQDIPHSLRALFMAFVIYAEADDIVDLLAELCEGKDLDEVAHFFL